MPPSPTPRRLGGFERLEDRALPSSFGTPWADPGHLTLGFVADGTATPAGPSGLFRALAGAGPAAAWQTEILRAFQTWAATANLNIGLVADGGQPLGSPGAVQGDARFGDIRVAAAPLAADQVAFASPFSWAGTTFAGDVLLAGGQSFSVGGAGGFDVFSVALHEAGHALGLDHEGGDSVMSPAYQFATGLSADDVAGLRALYGARTADAFDSAAPNGTLATASALAREARTGRAAAAADLTAAGDVDVYSFKAAATDSVVTLQAKGLSLLRARVSVYDAAGRLLATGAAADVFNNDVTLRLSGLKANASYLVKVEGATGDVFGVGAYRLTIDPGTTAAPPPRELPTADAHTNDTLPTATSLVKLQNFALDARFDATLRGAIEDATDTDFYRLRVPQAAGALNLNVLVWATDGALDPRVRVFDAAGKPVAFRVLANGGGVMSVVVPGATGTDYYVQVSSRSAGGTGGYTFAADFNQAAPPVAEEVGGGDLGPTAATSAATFTTGAAGIFEFGLYAEPLSAGAGGVTLTVTDALGRVVFVLDAQAGQPAVTVSQYLAAGTYTFRYAYRAANGQPAAPVRYHLGLTKLSEGVGTYAPGTGTTTGTPPSTTTYVAPTKPATGTWYFF